MRGIIKFPVVFNSLWTITQSNTEDGVSAMALSVTLNGYTNSQCTIYTNGTSNYSYWINIIGV